MDQVNRKIVAELLRDGRASFHAIGRAVGLSAPAVKRRVDVMVARGEIAGFTAIVDPTALGWNTEAYVEVFYSGNVSPAQLKRDLEEIPEVIAVSTVAGDADALVHVMAESMAGIERTVEKMRSSGHVAKTRSAIVMSRLIDRPTSR